MAYLQVHPGRTRLYGRINDQEYYRFKSAEREAIYERIRISICRNDSRLEQGEAVYLVPLGLGDEIYSTINADVSNWMRDPERRRTPIYSWIMPGGMVGAIQSAR
jgi:hypothetical protein